MAADEARAHAAQEIVVAALARVTDPPGTNRVCVEDYLAAVAAVTGEAAIVAAGLDIEALDMPPGSALFGDQINQILTGDTADLDKVPADTIVGILVTSLVPSVVALADFGSLEELYRSVAAHVGDRQRGSVYVSVGADHAPTIPPIRLAFELRPVVEAACADAGIAPAQRHQPCALRPGECARPGQASNRHQARPEARARSGVWHGQDGTHVAPRLRGSCRGGRG